MIYGFNNLQSSSSRRLFEVVVVERVLEVDGHCRPERWLVFVAALVELVLDKCFETLDLLRARSVPVFHLHSSLHVGRGRLCTSRCSAELRERAGRRDVLVDDGRARRHFSAAAALVVLALLVWRQNIEVFALVYRV